jgi:hypothetical protein
MRKVAMRTRKVNLKATEKMKMKMSVMMERS